MKYGLINRYLKILFSYYSGSPFFKPDTVSMIISKNCNLKCCMCEFWKNQKEVDHEQLPLETYISVFKQFKEYGVNAVQFTGGETLLYKDIFTLLENAKSVGLKTMMVTNGTLIDEEKADRIVKYIDVLYISVDGPSADIQDRVRGVEGTFKRIVKGTDCLVFSRKHGKNKRNCNIVFVSTITPESLHDPNDMDKLGKKLGVDRIIYNSASTVQYAHTTLHNTFLTGNDNSIFKRYNEMLDKILELMGKPDSLIKSNPFYLECSREFIRGNKKFYHIPCYGGGYNGALVSIDGQVFPCCAWSMPVGDLKKESFKDIWESDRAQGARKMIKARKCPVCFHHTRSFDFIIRYPLLRKDLKNSYKYLRSLGSF